MINISMFSDHEIEEIDYFKELMKGISVNGEKIICFEVLSDIIHGNILLCNIAKEKVEIVSKQLSNAGKICSDLNFFNDIILKEFEPKAQKLLSYILKSKSK